jgi:hypothetical protein
MTLFQDEMMMVPLPDSKRRAVAVASISHLLSLYVDGKEANKTGATGDLPLSVARRDKKRPKGNNATTHE